MPRASAHATNMLLAGVPSLMLGIGVAWASDRITLLGGATAAAIGACINTAWELRAATVEAPMRATSSPVDSARTAPKAPTRTLPQRRTMVADAPAAPAALPIGELSVYLDPAESRDPVQCPACGRFEVSAAGASAWRCQRCDHRWRAMAAEPWPATVGDPTRATNDRTGPTDVPDAPGTSTDQETRP